MRLGNSFSMMMKLSALGACVLLALGGCNKLGLGDPRTVPEGGHMMGPKRPPAKNMQLMENEPAAPPAGNVAAMAAAGNAQGMYAGAGSVWNADTGWVDGMPPSMAAPAAPAITPQMAAMAPPMSMAPGSPYTTPEAYGMMTPAAGGMMPEMPPAAMQVEPQMLTAQDYDQNYQYLPTPESAEMAPDYAYNMPPMDLPTPPAMPGMQQEPQFMPPPAMANGMSMNGMMGNQFAGMAPAAGMPPMPSMMPPAYPDYYAQELRPVSFGESPYELSARQQALPQSWQQPQPDPASVAILPTARQTPDVTPYAAANGSPEHIPANPYYEAYANLAPASGREPAYSSEPPVMAAPYFDVTQETVEQAAAAAPVPAPTPVQPTTIAAPQQQRSAPAPHTLASLAPQAGSLTHPAMVQPRPTQTAILAEQPAPKKQPILRPIEEPRYIEEAPEVRAVQDDMEQALAALNAMEYTPASQAGGRVTTPAASQQGSPARTAAAVEPNAGYQRRTVERYTGNGSYRYGGIQLVPPSQQQAYLPGSRYSSSNRRYY